MGFLKRLFTGGDEKEDVEPAREKHFNLEELEDRLNQVLEEKKSLAVKKSNPLVEEILKQKRAAIGGVEELKGLELDEDIKDRTYRPVITSKPVYIRGMLESLKGIKERPPERFDELMAFHANVTKALKAVQSVQHKKGRYMSFAFRKEMLRLGTTLNKIIDETASLEGIISGVEETLRPAEEVLKNLELLRGGLRTNEQWKEEEKSQKQRIEKLERKIASAEKELKDIEASSEYRDHLKRGENLANLISSKKNIENSIYGFINPLSRSIRKYERFLGHKSRGKVDKKTLEWINNYQKSPKKTFALEDYENIVLERILLGLREAVISGDIALDKKEKEKTLARIEGLKGDRLKKLLSELFELKEKIESLDHELSSSDIENRREALIKKIDSHTKELGGEGSAKQRGQPPESEIKDYKDKIEQAMSEIEGAPVKLTVHGLGN